MNAINHKGIPHLPSPNNLKDGELKLGDLIVNTLSGYAWQATQFDVDSIKPETFDNHRKFRKMLPII